VVGRGWGVREPPLVAVADPAAAAAAAAVVVEEEAGGIQVRWGSLQE